MSAPPRRPAPLRVHIEELRLEGFDPRHQHRIAGAVERELTRLLQAHAASEEPLSPSDAARVDGGSFAFRADESPGRIGIAIARATFRGLTSITRRGCGPDGG